MSIGGQWIVTQNKFWIKRKWLNMANIVNFTDKQFENRLNDNLEELVQVKSGWIANRFFTWWAIRVRENQFAKKMIEQAGTKW